MEIFYHFRVRNRVFGFTFMSLNLAYIKCDFSIFFCLVTELNLILSPNSHLSGSDKMELLIWIELFTLYFTTNPLLS